MSASVGAPGRRTRWVWSPVIFIAFPFSLVVVLNAADQRAISCRPDSIPAKSEEDSDAYCGSGLRCRLSRHGIAGRQLTRSGWRVPEQTGAARGAFRAGRIDRHAREN